MEGGHCADALESEGLDASAAFVGHSLEELTQLDVAATQVPEANCWGAEVQNCIVEACCDVVVEIDFVGMDLATQDQIEEGHLERKDHCEIEVEVHLGTWEAHLEIEDLIGIEDLAGIEVADHYGIAEAHFEIVVDLDQVGQIGEVQKVGCWEIGAYLED